MSTMSTTDAAPRLSDRFDGTGVAPVQSLLIVEPVRTQPGVARFPLDGRKWMVGSDADCTVRLPHDGVQPRHCLILHGPQGPIIKAWDHRTWVNDRPVREAPLRDGDRLAVGPVVLRVRKVTVDEWQEVAAREPEVAKRIEEQPVVRERLVARVAEQVPAVPREPEPLEVAPTSVVAPPVAEIESISDRGTDEARARLARRMADLRHRRAELGARQREMDQAAARLSAREAELSQRERTARNLIATTGGLDEREQRLTRSEAELATATADLERRNRELTRALEQAEAARSLAAELRTGVERKRSLMTDLADELLRQQATVETGRKALEHDRASSTALRTELDRRRAEIAASEQSLQRRLSDLTTRESVAESARIELARKEQSLRELELSVQDELRRAEDTLATADARVARADARLAEIDEAQRRADAARESERAEQTRLLDEAKAALAAEAVALEQSREALRQREAELVERDAGIARQVERIEADRRELAEHADLLAQQSDELATREAAIKEQTRELSEQREVVDRIRDELSAETQRHSRMEIEFASHRSELKGLELALSDRAGALDARETEIARRAAELTDRESRLAADGESLTLRMRDAEQAESRAERLVAEAESRDKELAERQAALDALAARQQTRDDELGAAGLLHREREAEHDRRLEDVARRETDLAERAAALDEDERLLRARSESLAARERNLAEAEGRLEPTLREAERTREETRRGLERVEADRAVLEEQGREVQLLREEIEHGTARLSAEEERLFERERELRDREDACDERLDDLRTREAALERESRALEEARQAAVIGPAPAGLPDASAEEAAEIARRRDDLESRELALESERTLMDRRADELRAEAERLAAETADLGTAREELERREGGLRAESQRTRDAEYVLDDARSALEGRVAELESREAALRERESQLEEERRELDQRRQSLQAIAALVEETPEAELTQLAPPNALPSPLENDPPAMPVMPEPRVETLATSELPTVGVDDDWDHAPVELPTWQREQAASPVRIESVATVDSVDSAPLEPRLSIDAEVRRELLAELDRPLLDLPDVLDSARFTPDPGTGDFIPTVRDDASGPGVQVSPRQEYEDNFGVFPEAATPADAASDELASGGDVSFGSIESAPTSSSVFDLGLAPGMDSDSFAADLDRRLRLEDERIRELEQKWDTGERLDEVTRLIGERSGETVGDMSVGDMPVADMEESGDSVCDAVVVETDAQTESVAETAVALVEPCLSPSIGSVSALGDIARENLFGELDLGVDTETLLGEAIALDREPEVPEAPEMDAFTDEMALRLGLMDSTPQQIADGAWQNYSDDSARHINNAAKAAKKAARAASQAAKATNEVVKVAAEVLKHRSDELDERDHGGDHTGGHTGGGTTVLGGAVIVPGGAWSGGHIGGSPEPEGVALEEGVLKETALPAVAGGGGTVVVGGPWINGPVMGAMVPEGSAQGVAPTAVGGAVVVPTTTPAGIQTHGALLPTLMMAPMASVTATPDAGGDALRGLQEAVGKLNELVAHHVPTVHTPAPERAPLAYEPGALLSLDDVESLVQPKAEPKPAPKSLTPEMVENPTQVRSLLAEMFGMKDLPQHENADGEPGGEPSASGQDVTESGDEPGPSDIEEPSSEKVEEPEAQAEPEAEESISDYMERLLARNRKGGGGASAPASTAKPAASESRLLPASPARVEDLDLSHVTGGSKPEVDEEPAPAPIPRERVNPEELRVRHEFLRELANQSARQALALYRERQQRLNRYFKGATCAAGLGLAGFVLGGFSGAGGLQAIHGWIALGIAGFMGTSLGIDIHGLRKMKAHAKGKRRESGAEGVTAPEPDDSLVIVEYDE